MTTPLPPEHDPRLPWTQPGWLARAGAWIEATLARLGIKRCGSITQPHVRPWSTVLQIPTDQGNVYFKASIPALGHEAALTEALYRLRPDCITPVLATEPAQGWMLMGDAGVTLRSLIQAHPKEPPQDPPRLDSAENSGRWREVLSQYATLQIEMIDRVPDLLALGALDRRLSTLPNQYAQLLADTAILRLGQPGGLTEAEYAGLQALAPRVAEMCHALAYYPVPETLYHDDFHDGNIFVRDGRTLFTDWAESCVGHPFFTQTVLLRGIGYRFGWEPYSARLEGMRAAYLDPWLAFADRDTLWLVAWQAERLGMVCRALTWHRASAPLAPDLQAEYGEPVAGWLQEFLAAETRKNEEDD
jgi:hypothetical protein